MNYATVNLDLQSVVRRAYDNLLYRSSFMNFLNSAYLGEIRQAGTPMLEVVKQSATTVNSTQNAPVLTNALTPALATYESVKVDLAELRIDYSFRVPSLVLESGIAQIIDGQIEANDSEASVKVDTYGYGIFNTAITGAVDGSEALTKGTQYVWDASTSEDYIQSINELKAMLFDRNVYSGYKLGLVATEYGKLVSALTTILKFETDAGIEGVDRGEVARAYGIDIFPVNTNAITNTNVKGYFASEVGTVGDAFFSKFNEFNGSYPGFPGDYICEGLILFGAKVIRPEAVVKLVVTAG